MIVEGVFVIKITGVLVVNDKVTVELENTGCVEVSKSWFLTHNPKAGGYLTQCNDGYLSYCPANAYNAIQQARNIL